jgi:hypothetical protein
MRKGITLVLVSALVLAGCAMQPRPDAMVPERVSLSHKSSADVSIAVSGGQELTATSGRSQISNDSFAKALAGSIEKSGLFARVSPAGAHYKLTAFIGKVDQPMFGFSLTVKMEVSYTLVDTRSGSTVWTKNIPSDHTAKVGEHFVGVERLRLATEGAAKDNIRQALEEIAALNLP